MSEMTVSAKNVLDENRKQPRVSFFLGASMALGWELTYEDLFSLGDATRSLAECFDVLDIMKRAIPSRRVIDGIGFVGGRREAERLAGKVAR